MNIEELKAKMHAYFREKKNEMQVRAREYKDAGREQEAELEMGRLDVYDIFGTMMEASALKVTMNPKYASEDKVKAFTREYLMTFITQPAEWRMNYSKAKERGEQEEMKREELRLATVQEIRDYFVKISKEAQP